MKLTVCCKQQFVAGAFNIWKDKVFFAFFFKSSHRIYIGMDHHREKTNASFMLSDSTVRCISRLCSESDRMSTNHSAYGLDSATYIREGTDISRGPGRLSDKSSVMMDPLDGAVPSKVRDKIWARKYVDLAALLLDDEQEIELRICNVLILICIHVQPRLGPTG